MIKINISENYAKSLMKKYGLEMHQVKSLVKQRQIEMAEALEKDFVKI